MLPVKLTPNSPVIPNVLTLVQQAFAFMETRINPSSSMHRLTVEAIKEHCTSGEVWTLGERPAACVFLRAKETCLYMGKLAVRQDRRGQGLARQLVELAERRAKAKGFSVLELETRIELVENHATFGRFGFVKTGEGTHHGFDRPTYIVMQKALDASALQQVDR